MAEKKEARNIGLNVMPPSISCTDPKCPFHGTLPVRGQVLTGTVVSTKMHNTVSVEREFMHFVKKFERYKNGHRRTMRTVHPA